MKKLLTIAALAPLALSACTLAGNPLKKDVTGQLRGFASGQNLGLALVGFNNGQYTADGTESQVIDKFLTGGFALDLPTNVPFGTYRVIVFRDANNNNRYDAGDVVLSKDNGKRLAFAQSDNQFFAGTKKGWNLVSPDGNVQTTLLNNYDLDAQ
jgi:outer membrane lipoprotein-sorting protein